MKMYATPDRVFRVARAAGPWDLAPWMYAPFNGRWDDPDQEFRVRYGGVTRFAAFVERIAAHRPDLDLLVSIASIENAEPSRIAPMLPPGWFNDNAAGVAGVDVPTDNGIVDLATGEGMAAAYAAVEVARRRVAFALRDYDASTLLSGTPRRFTQAISRYVYDAGFAGIAYRSRYAPEEICVALFEARHELVGEEASPIAIDDADLRRACVLHHLMPQEARAARGTPNSGQASGEAGAE